MVKKAADLVATASAEIEKLSMEDAKALHGRDDVVFVDVREPPEVAKGKIAGAVHVPRGLLEFAADPESPMHNPALGGGKRLVVYCASGGRGALATKTLKDMGLADAANLTGGFGGWQSGGGKVEP
jgi:rhodanese-related sulfurtransferase